MAFGGSNSYPTPVVNFIGGTTATSASAQTYSFAGVSLGTALADRTTIAGFFLQGAVNTGIASVTIAGITATIATQSLLDGTVVGFALANVTGTTATIVVSAFTTQTSAKAGITVYSLSGYQLNTAVAFNSTAAATSGTTLGLAQKVPVNGSVLGIAGVVTNAASQTSTFSFSPPPNDFSSFITFNVAFASGHLVKANRSQSVTATCGTSLAIGVLTVIALG